MTASAPERRTSLVTARALANVPLVGAAVRGVCQEYLGSPQSTGLVEVALVEAFVNAVRHAGPHQQSPVRVDLLVTDDRVEFVMAERGVPYDVAAAAMPEFDAHDVEGLPEGGLGIPIIKSVMDEVIYERVGDVNLLRLVKRRDGETSPGPAPRARGGYRREL